MDNEAGVCLDFLAELVSRFDEDESYADILVRSMVDISAKVANMTMADDYRPGMNVCVFNSKRLLSCRHTKLLKLLIIGLNYVLQVQRDYAGFGQG